MTEVNLTIYGEPKGKGRHRVARTPYGVRTYTPNETMIGEARIAYVFKAECKDFYADIGEPVELTVQAYMAIPASASKKKREQMIFGEIRPMKKPDWDNIGKLVSDALNGIAWHDDAQVVTSIVEKHYTADKPRIEVKIRKGNRV